MVLKRNFDDDGDDDESEFSAHEHKRKHIFGGIVKDVIKEASFQDFAMKFEPVFRCLVREEVERVISSYFGSSNDHIGSSGSRTSELHFEGKTPRTLFTGTKVESEDNTPVKIVLRDASSKIIISTGPLSSIKISIYVLNGDFNPDDREDWTEQEFNNKILKEREGRRPLVTGKSIIQLKDGIGYIDDICFTDNSSWIRSRKFRLGAKVLAVSAGVRIREGVSTEFQVKDHRGESYKKHYPPSMNDEVWRLEKIAKDGKSHERLSLHGIFTVRGFLQLYVTNPNSLRNILDSGISERRWKTITDHANSCVLDNNELYMYGATEGISVVFDSIFKVVGAIFDGQNFQTLEKLDIFQKRMVENLKQRAYKNTKNLVRIDGQLVIGFPGCSMQLPSPHNVNLQIEQDQAEMQINSDHTTISPSLTCEVEENNQFEGSVAESSHRMQTFDSTFRNSFSLTDAYYGLNTEGYSWDPTGFARPLISSDHLAFNENFQVQESEIQGNGSGLFTAPINQEIHLVSSDLGIHISRNRNSKVRWCKIRAAIKWRILVRQKWLSREWDDFCI